MLSVTPSAVSHALSRLRYSIGDELFIPSQSGMQPTRAEFLIYQLSHKSTTDPKIFADGVSVVKPRLKPLTPSPYSQIRLPIKLNCNTPFLHAKLCPAAAGPILLLESSVEKQSMFD